MKKFVQKVTYLSLLLGLTTGTFTSLRAATIKSNFLENRAIKQSNNSSINRHNDPFACTMRVGVVITDNQGNAYGTYLEADGKTCEEAGKNLDTVIFLYGVWGYICSCYSMEVY